MSLDLAPFKRLIRQRCGLVFEGVGERRLATVLSERMGSSDAQHYLVQLEADTDEFGKVVNQLTINETYFFREMEQFDLLTDVLVPRLMSRRPPGVPIRILSAGCSSGEEPYSIAMALFDRFGENTLQRFKIVAGDIDSTVIARAREARYSEFSFRSVGQGLRSRYFRVEHNAHVLTDAVRNAVEFHELNLLHPAFAPTMPAFDIVFMRNVSIYFDVPIRLEIQRNLAAMMSGDGYLVTGMTETLANDLGVFSLVEDGGLYYFCRQAPQPAPMSRASIRSATPDHPAHRALTKSQPPSHRLHGEPAAKTHRPVPGAVVPTLSLVSPVAPARLPTLEEARALVHDERYDDASPLVQKLLTAQPHNNDARLLQAYIHLNRRNFELALDGCSDVLAADAWSVDALFVMGLAEKWREQSAAAIAWFKKAAYLHQQCWPAHFYLAGLYSAQGDHAAAGRAHRVVLRLLAGVPDPGIRVVPVGLRPAEVRFLCERRLNVVPTPMPMGGS